MTLDILAAIERMKQSMLEPRKPEKYMIDDWLYDEAVKHGIISADDPKFVRYEWEPTKEQAPCVESLHWAVRRVS